MKRYEVLQWAFSFLKEHSREEKVAEILLQYVTGESGATFLANLREELDEEMQVKFKALVEKHALLGVPVQHVIGSAPFYGRDFFVNEDVLIPRFETEEVVWHTIEKIKTLASTDSFIVADLGTGSGVIAITIALELPEVIVYATDISEKALRVAKKNAGNLGANITFLHGDFLQPLIKENINPHVIVSNPPYIAYTERQQLSDTVEKYDPEIALFAENNGLAAYETIAEQIKLLPKRSERIVIFEIGHGQGEAVTDIMKRTFLSCDVSVLQDINGKDRIVSVKIFQ
jgi:release factor glutamine methyltransferase